MANTTIDTAKFVAEDMTHEEIQEMIKDQIQTDNVEFKFNIGFPSYQECRDFVADYYIFDQYDSNNFLILTEELFESYKTCGNACYFTDKQDKIIKLYLFNLSHCQIKLDELSNNSYLATSMIYCYNPDKISDLIDEQEFVFYLENLGCKNPIKYITLSQRRPVKCVDENYETDNQDDELSDDQLANKRLSKIMLRPIKIDTFKNYKIYYPSLRDYNDRTNVKDKLRYKLPKNQYHQVRVTKENYQDSFNFIISQQLTKNEQKRVYFIPNKKRWLKWIRAYETYTVHDSTDNLITVYSKHNYLIGRKDNSSIRKITDLTYLITIDVDPMPCIMENLDSCVLMFKPQTFHELKIAAQNMFYEWQTIYTHSNQNRLRWSYYKV